MLDFTFENYGKSGFYTTVSNCKIIFGRSVLSAPDFILLSITQQIEFPAGVHTVFEIPNN